MNDLIKKRLALKRKFQNREKIFGTWTSLAHPSITEIFSRTGAGFLGIDLEHSTISQEQSQRIIATAQAGGAVCLPRISSHNPEMVRRLMDSGADGMIVPMVQNAEDVEKMIAWMKYPPLGRRGFGVSRAQGYGMDFAEYTKTWNNSSIMIGQIESIGAVERIDEILSYKELDGVMVGPYDISGSLGIPGQIEHKKVIEAGKRVIAACKRHGKSCGTQLVEPSAERIKKAVTTGFTFVILSSDVFLLWKWAEQMKTLTAHK
ncbi:MAG: 4-hydroxy-2-oxovalerate aldolase [Candidatus Omnitrophica bacterium]|nr:4-hydroxy-2-oxovalerate aldolase [Candidatus Omnitrophota bacterium]